ncbi:unnamed protein product [Bursaphelenchus okinawaensis]|uniref:Protein kinase domain-containing protein n=1 Tax=Bursaphelenchus okinawaensis TaxID=465554 RepID=A0A811KCK6_9BILA|nr:unnamed protein product [Bursaphelenchus okinawaensis]CAG9096920.1 unnamed protein product [Bursaphelenchus okinawaensis]
MYKLFQEAVPVQGTVIPNQQKIGNKLFKEGGKGNIQYTIIAIINNTSQHFLYLCDCSENKPRCVVKSYKRSGTLDRSIFREMFVWAYLKRFGKFERLCPPITSPNDHSLSFPVLGPSLGNLRKTFGPLTVEATLRVGMEMLHAIHELHETGLVHRNITPEHFCLHSHNAPGHLFGKMVLIDLTSALPYCSTVPFNEVIPNLPPATNGVFSPAARDDFYKYGRNDDLISWIFMMLYLRHPTDLPWEPKEQRHLKRLYWTDISKMLYVFGPIAGPFMYQIVMHIKMLNNSQAPRYLRIYKWLKEAVTALTDGKFSKHYVKSGVQEELNCAVWNLGQPCAFSYYQQVIESELEYDKLAEMFKEEFQASPEAVEQFNKAQELSVEARAAFKRTYGKWKRYQPMCLEFGVPLCKFTEGLKGKKMKTARDNAKEKTVDDETAECTTMTIDMQNVPAHMRPEVVKEVKDVATTSQKNYKTKLPAVSVNYSAQADKISPINGANRNERTMFTLIPKYPGQVTSAREKNEELVPANVGIPSLGSKEEDKEGKSPKTPKTKLPGKTRRRKGT